MSKKIQVVHDGNEIKLTGALTQSTAVDALIMSEKILRSSPQLNINLAQVTCCDSASLAYIIAVIRLNKNIRFVEIPQQILDLGKVSGLDRLLSLRSPLAGG